MNVNLMIIVLAFVCVSSIIVFGIKYFKQKKKTTLFVNKMKPKVKSATTIEQLISLYDTIYDYVSFNNTFIIKSRQYNEAKLLLTSINAKIELLDRI